METATSAYRTTVRARKPCRTSGGIRRRQQAELRIPKCKLIAQAHRNLRLQFAQGQVFLGYVPDAEVIDPLAGLQLCGEPARRLSSPRPSLGRPIRIPKLRNDCRIWPLPCR